MARSKNQVTSTIAEARETHASAPLRLEGALNDIVSSCLTLVVPMCALTAAFLALVFYYRVPTPTNDSSSAYYVNYSATRLITVSSWTSTAASLIAPFAMTMLSYPIARSYQQKSVNFTSKSQLPTTYQLSMIVGMLGGGVGYLWQNIKYSSWKGRPSSSGILGAATAGASLFLMLSVGILAADTWLHVATSTISYGIVEMHGNATTAFSRSIDAYCFGPRGLGNDPTPCISGVTIGDAFAKDTGMHNSVEAYQTLANVSVRNQVHLSAVDGILLAQLIDSSSGSSLDYKASTFGVSTRCTPISRSCNLAQSSYCAMNFCAGQIAYDSSMTYSCPGDPGLVGNLMNNTGTAFDDGGSSSGVSSNIGFLLQFFNDSALQIMHGPESVYYYENPLYFVTGAYLVMNSNITSDPDVIANGNGDGSGIIFGCTATSYDIDFDFTNGSVSSVNMTKANDTIATNIGFAMATRNARKGFQSYLENGMLSGGQLASDAQDMADYSARTYSQVAVGIAAAIMTPQATIREQERHNVLVARLPKAPFFTLLVLNLLYSVCGLALTIWALCSHPRATRDVQARLSIAGIIANMLEPEGQPMKGKGIEGLFSERRLDQSHRLEKRIAIRRHDDSRWVFEIAQGIADVKAYGSTILTAGDNATTENKVPLLSSTGPAARSSSRAGCTETHVVPEDESRSSFQFERHSTVKKDYTPHTIPRKPFHRAVG